MKVMVLGAAGMLGTAVSSVLAASHQVFPRTRKNWDITDAAACRKDIIATKPHAVINCAAFTQVDACERKPDYAFLVNGEAVRHIGEACQLVNSLFVQISTDYVFDGEKGEPYCETDSPHPMNVYGQSKLLGEKEALKVKTSLIIRTSWLYGPKGTNFVNTILGLALKNKRLTVVDDQLGSPTYSVDLAAAIARLLERKITGVIHVTNSGVCSWYEFAKEILKIAGRNDISVLPIKSTEINRPARRPHFSALDCSRFAALAGAPLRPWPEALAAYLASSLSH